MKTLEETIFAHHLLEVSTKHGADGTAWIRFPPGTFLLLMDSLQAMEEDWQMLWPIHSVYCLPRYHADKVKWAMGVTFLPPYLSAQALPGGMGFGGQEDEDGLLSTGSFGSAQ